MTHDFYRPASLNQVSAALDASGNLTGLTMKMTSQSVTARAFPPFVVEGNDPFMTEGSANLTYGVANLRIENVIHDSGVRVGYWRAVSNNLNTFAIESFIDEVALKTKQDPLKLRLNLLAKAPRAQKVLQAAANQAGWGQAAAGHHLGLAQTECYGTYVATVADISMSGKTPVVHKLTVAVDPGVALRPDQVKAQIESAVLLGYSAAMKSEITFKDGEVAQTNFNAYPLLRMSEAPQVEVIVMPSGDDPGGMGEVGVPCVAPAIANAIAAATNVRPRRMPFVTT
jgi:isoquinoline 1-oxidoreductase beta subunit